VRPIVDALNKDLAEYRARGLLTVAFVGEYTAGKSTIISALTGRRDIAISADIATDRTTEYEWNGTHVIDTPGLFTERRDHDAITYDAIRRADLVAFCLTHQLFDSITVENFKKLAFDDGYRPKMLLVVNKMSAEAGHEPGSGAGLDHGSTCPTISRPTRLFVDVLDEPRVAVSRGCSALRRPESDKGERVAPRAPCRRHDQVRLDRRRLLKGRGCRIVHQLLWDNRRRCVAGDVSRDSPDGCLPNIFDL
jgi:hypothetical protein